MKNYIRTVFVLLAFISNNVWAQSRPISADQKALILFFCVVGH